MFTNQQTQLEIIKQKIKEFDVKYCQSDLEPHERELWFILRGVLKSVKTHRFWITLAKKNNEPFDDIEAVIDNDIDYGINLIGG